MKMIAQAGLAVLVCVAAHGQDTVSGGYSQTNLVSDLSGARTKDPDLKNPWGITRGPGKDWWVADQAAGVTTVYDGTGNKLPLVVTIPPASGTGPGMPSGAANFGHLVFVTLDGTISEWTGGASTAIRVNHGSSASYTGCTVATSGAA